MDYNFERDFIFEQNVERDMINWFNDLDESQERYNPNKIHVTELNTCLLMSAGDRVLVKKYEYLFEVNKMFIGKAIEDAMIRYKLLENIYPHERFDLPLKEQPFSITGEVDIDTARRGIFELKSTGEYKYLPGISNYPHLTGTNIVGGVYNKSPIPAHIDQVGFYIVFFRGRRRVANIVYFSRVWGQGLTAFTIHYQANEIRANRDIIINRATRLYDAYIKAMQLSGEENRAKYLTTVLDYEASGLCSYCRLGGYISEKTYPNARIPGYPNYCPATMRERAHYLPQVSTVPRGPLGDGGGGLEYNADLVKLIYRNIISTISEKSIKKQKETRIDKIDFRLLFLCPRVARHYYDGTFADILLYGIDKPRDSRQYRDTTVRSVNLFNNIAIRDMVEDVLGTKVGVISDYIIVSLNLKSTGRNMVAETTYPIIDGFPTIVVPSSKVADREEGKLHPSGSRGIENDRNPAVGFATPTPYYTNLDELFYAQLIGNREFRLLYYPIESDQAACYKIIMPSELDVEQIVHPFFKRVENIFANVTTRVGSISKGLPDPRIWCLWCPIRIATDQTGVSLCPEGVQWVSAFFQYARPIGTIPRKDAIEEEPLDYADAIGKY
jgi:hypothetical protein